MKVARLETHVSVLWLSFYHVPGAIWVWSTSTHVSS